MNSWAKGSEGVACAHLTLPRQQSTSFVAQAPSLWNCRLQSKSTQINAGREMHVYRGKALIRSSAAAGRALNTKEETRSQEREADGGQGTGGKENNEGGIPGLENNGAPQQ